MIELPTPPLSGIPQNSQTRTRRHWLGLTLAVSTLLANPLHAQTSPAATGSKTPKILVLGDSLSAEYGLTRGSGWVALLEQQLKQQGSNATVVNASISGDTTSGGASRLPSLLADHQPSIVVIELGGNDALRGLNLTLTHDNLTRMVQQTQEAGAQPILVGMQIPPNYGPAYSRNFAALFETVAKATKARLVPFLLAGIETDESRFQADRIHPNESAQPQLLENVWPAIQQALP